MKTPEQIIERLEERLEKYRTALSDIRHIFLQYRTAHPDEAWETIRKLAFDKNLK